MEVHKEKRPLEIVSDVLGRIIFGPRIVGEVSAVKNDLYDPNIQHILIRTERGFTYVSSDLMATMIGFDNGGVKLSSEVDHRVGDPIDMRVRGHGITALPWANMERDPFGLKT